MKLVFVPVALAATVLAIATTPACSLADGEGEIRGTLDVPSCWRGKFDLGPDFFAGIPYKNSLELRIQNGGDYETFSDGIAIFIDDITQIRPSDDGSFQGLYGLPLAVSLPPAVTPPGVPVKAVASPAQVHFTLYLQRTCRTQNVALYGVDEVLLGPDGSCDGTVPETPLACTALAPAGADGGVAGDASVSPDASGPAPDAGGVTPVIGRSTITFATLFDGKPDEADAAKRLNEGSFDVYLADPREVCPGGLGAPPRCRGHLTGTFKFYFQRGRPAQPFP